MNELSKFTVNAPGIIYKTFQGEVKVESQSIGVKEEHTTDEQYWLFSPDRGKHSVLFVKIADLCILV
jgi:hypothetical protein